MQTQNLSLAIREAATKNDIIVARRLFEKYAAWLEMDLSFQWFEEELATLPTAYARPSGLILLAARGETTVGCVALRKVDDRIGEIKRLYVESAYRSYGIGRRLMEDVIEEAKKIGYSIVRLDTLPKMEAARALYRSLRFKAIEPYYYNPIEGTVYMQLSLG